MAAWGGARRGANFRRRSKRSAERFDRLLLVLALAYLLLVGLGLHARAHYHPGHWSSAAEASQRSVFTIGRRMPDKLELPPVQAPAQLRAALSSGLETWG